MYRQIAFFSIKWQKNFHTKEIKILTKKRQREEERDILGVAELEREEDREEKKRKKTKERKRERNREIERKRTFWTHYLIFITD